MKLLWLLPVATGAAGAVILAWAAAASLRELHALRRAVAGFSDLRPALAELGRSREEFRRTATTMRSR